MVSSAAALATFALLAGAPGAAPVAELSRASLPRGPDLTLHLVGELLSDARVVGSRVESPAATPPPCLADVCQSAVAVPGFEPRYGRGHRSELFVLALQKARIEPLASVAWALVATGLRFDYAPPLFDGNANAHGWGSVTVRLRVRIDARNHLVFPKKPSAS